MNLSKRLNQFSTQRVKFVMDVKKYLPMTHSSNMSHMLRNVKKPINICTYILYKYLQIELNGIKYDIYANTEICC